MCLNMFYLVFTMMLMGMFSIYSASMERDIECLLPKEQGFCQGNHLRFYYDINTETCKPFRYTGCGGNRNRFRSIGGCMRKCSNLREIENEKIQQYIPSRCMLSRKVGPCQMHRLSYFFNHYTHKCQPFRYSGCGGNANRFDTLAQCRQACKPLHYLSTPKPMLPWNGIRWYHHSPGYEFNLPPINNDMLQEAPVILNFMETKIPRGRRSLSHHRHSVIPIASHMHSTLPRHRHYHTKPLLHNKHMSYMPPSDRLHPVSQFLPTQIGRHPHTDHHLLQRKMFSIHH